MNELKEYKQNKCLSSLRALIEAALSSPRGWITDPHIYWAQAQAHFCNTKNANKITKKRHKMNPVRQ